VISSWTAPQGQPELYVVMDFSGSFACDTRLVRAPGTIR